MEETPDDVRKESQESCECTSCSSSVQIHFCKILIAFKVFTFDFLPNWSQGLMHRLSSEADLTVSRLPTPRFATSFRPQDRSSSLIKTCCRLDRRVSECHASELNKWD